MKEALGEAANCGSPAVAGLMAGAVRDIASLLIAPPPPSERAQLQVHHSALWSQSACRSHVHHVFHVSTCTGSLFQVN